MKRYFPLIVGVFGLVFLVQSNPVTFGQNNGGGEQKEEALEFTGVSKCKLCHNRRTTGKFVDNWEETKHAKAFERLKGDERKDPDCLKCHTTGYGKPGGFVSFEETPEMANVQCEMCHGPAEKHNKSRPNNVVPVAWEVGKERCTTCHNENNPNWDPEKYTLPDGSTSGFYFEEAVKQVNHSEIRDEE